MPARLVRPEASFAAVQVEARTVKELAVSTPHERGSLSSFITQGATEGRTGYETSWKRWVAYVGGLDESVRPNLFLGDLNPHAQAVRLSCYVKHLHDSGIREWTLERDISNLKMVFLEALVDVTSFSSSLLQRTRRAARPTAEEFAILQARRVAKQSLPTSLDVIWPLREEYWSGETWLCPGLDRRGVWVAIALGFDCGARVSNLAKCDRRRGDHTIKAKDVIVVYLANGDPRPRRAQGGEVLRRIAGELGDFPGCVLKVEYHFLTGKKNMPKDWHTLGRRTSEESSLLDDLILYLLRSRVRGTDPLFTRYPGPGDATTFSRKVLTSRQVQGGLDWAAANAGLPLGSVKTSGVRRGCAETARASGATREELCHGRWSSSSNVPFRHYLSQAGERDNTGREVSQGSMARGSSVEGVAFSVSDVKAIAVARGVMDCCGEDFPRVGGQQS